MYYDCRVSHEEQTNFHQHPVSYLLNNFINDGGKVDEHDGSNGQKLENLDEIYSMYNSLAEMNLAHYFAPSFYIIAE